MSYPDQEKQVDKLSEKVDIPQKAKRSPDEVRIKPESRLPVGKLKWSKEEEEQEPRVNLEETKAAPEQGEELSELKPLRGGAEPKNDPQQPKASHPAPSGQKAPVSVQQKRSERVEPLRADLSVDPSGTRGNPSSSPDLHKIPETAGPDERDQGGRSSERTGSPALQPPKKPLSLEDTLTPIHFKEYSIDPLPEEPKESQGFRTEMRKPAYVAEPSAFDLEEPEEEYGLPEEKTWLKHPAVRMAIKILWLPALLVAVLITGLIIGHSVIGNEPVGDVFDMDMWEHVYHLIYG